MDNLTIVIISFDNLLLFINDRPRPTRLENHLFQIKEVESGATSTIVQPTPGLSDSVVGTGRNNLSQAISPGKVHSSAPSEERRLESDQVEEVRTEDLSA